jgi:hypothetical protein
LIFGIVTLRLKPRRQGAARDREREKNYLGDFITVKMRNQNPPRPRPPKYISIYISKIRALTSLRSLSTEIKCG